MNDYSRLIEHAFPLRQASIDSVHERNVRHGHISTLHIWPARRPLAASRAALLATLLADPGTPEGRKELCEKIGGKLKIEADKDGRLKEVTEGGILRWKREIENKEVLDRFREEICKANGGKPPKVLDPFAGGGAIPLEAMRLGCEVTVADLNPVAWFILKCTLEYPQKLARQTRQLPAFILRDREFMHEFLKKVKGLNGAKLQNALEALGHATKAGEHHQNEMDFEGARATVDISLEADLAWHVRAWGRKVLAEACKHLANFYTTYAEWQPLVPGQPFEPQPVRLIEPNEDGTANAGKLNADLTQEYLDNKFNPRWVAKPAVAYLWARTVTCKNCRATVPLVKTRWLCKKDSKRIRLLMEPKADRSGVLFSIQHNVPERGGNATQKRENDRKLGAGTMSRAGAQCLCCPTIMEMEDIRYEGKNGRLSQIMTAIVVNGPSGKEYRLPTQHERAVAEVSEDALHNVLSQLPFGLSNDRIEPASTRSISCHEYGLATYHDLFTPRQRIFIGTTIQIIRGILNQPEDRYWVEAVAAYLLCVFDKCLDYGSTLVTWYTQNEQITHLFNRYALPMTWDYVECAPLGGASGSLGSMLRSVARSLEETMHGLSGCLQPEVAIRNATESQGVECYDVVITDPPYYQAVSYADLSEFFFTWLRCALADRFGEMNRRETPKDEEIVQHIRSDKNREVERHKYEDRMAAAFASTWKALRQNGRFVIVFAHKEPDAWATLVTAIIKAGFVVEASWPIQTEMPNRSRGFSVSSLASSVWLVCRKRDPLAKVGWDNRVMAEMRENIASQLREFWDAGIRGPDFVWAATGPAMEAYSKYPIVKKANSPTNELLSVKEFLDAVRRIVIEFVVGRVLHIESGTDRLDPVTSYYLLHRNDFGFEKAPAGACILYAVSCGLSDAELERTWNLVKVKGSTAPNPDDSEDEVRDGEGEPPEEMSGGEFVLRTWKERSEKRMGLESIGGREVPLIDRIHRLMHLWRDGDVRKVDDYLDNYALRRQELFVRLIQSLIELSEQGSDERALLESLSNHLGAKAAKADTTQRLVFDDEV